ncbi:metallophosphoesterase [Blastopirellula marina]|uniref:Metallophosphoesterase n=1 Tax=Blastopirellula marina TaxID=124 RepID=A0A2S8GF61_9BACT|nr:metallophosphoesterase [Blastopirellula marina]PQO43105.1 metallophosphoesterase [Blastopirellula marina]
MRRLTLLLTITLLAAQAQSLLAHEGPDPIAHWKFREEAIDGDQLKSRLGPDVKLSAGRSIAKDDLGESLLFAGDETGGVIADDWKQVADLLPKQDFTIAAWVAVHSPLEWGGIIGALQDNGDSEQGWILGYDHQSFYVGLATKGADDGDGKMTYLKGKTKYEKGMLYHVVAVYDGKLLELYVNGQLDASSEEQSGEILYPKSAPVVVGGYRDANENHPMHGRIRELSLYDLAAKAAWVAHDFEHGQALAKLPAYDLAGPLSYVIRPYLQYGTQTGMTMMWRTNKKGTTVVHYGETDACDKQVEASGADEMHEVRVEGLAPDTQYFYRTETIAADGAKLVSDVSTFRTAIDDRDTPFAFAVMSDTQGNPAVSGKLAEYAWAQRPSFLLHAGDLVNTGSDDRQWTHEFFSSMNPLISRVAFYPVIGNHETYRYKDGRSLNYYRYMSLPDPEYYYTFRYGNTQFFMIDTNQKVDPDSEQYKWLEQQLFASTADWKIVCHHHPAYSSDGDDYGNLWKTNKGTHGDLRVRQLVPLYEKYNVDIVWSGHIHTYERTWPIKQNKAVQEGAPVYMITGGGGGHLELAGPTRPFFQNNVYRGHHWAMVYVNHGKLEFKAYDLDNHLFDTFTIEKKVK